MLLLTRLSRVPRACAALLQARAQVQARAVSQSSPKDREVLPVVSKPPDVIQLQQAEEVCEYKKNPDYHGFSSDPFVDEVFAKAGFFVSVSVALVIGGTYMAYEPDHNMRDWARHEAEREVVRREREGLPLIDENYYDPSTIVMPPPEEYPAPWWSVKQSAPPPAGES